MHNNKKFGSLYDSKSKNGSKSSDMFEKNSSNLFFQPFSNPIVQNENISEDKSENSKFLNDVDSSLIMENIDNSAKNRVVKINLKIKTLEKNLTKISEELKILELFNLDKDKDRREELNKLMQNILKQIENLKSEKAKYGIIYILAAYTNNKINIENTELFISRCVNSIKKYYLLFKHFVINFMKKYKFISDLFKSRG